jgi:hypothetical protein
MELVHEIRRRSSYLTTRVPAEITNHIARCFTGKMPTLDLTAYDESGTRRRHVPIIRECLNVSSVEVLRTKTMTNLQQAKRRNPRKEPSQKLPEC